ncbi:phenylalanine--tRNA ligase subunit beta [Candidatus Pacearchaeota archaeon]|nr:phenylalanine--tRNA ligase subunit beta [Candidatus Pacearchaeota archaeon]
MAVLTLNRKELEKVIGKITPELENKIGMFGTPVDKLTDEEISIEIFPNRPDLLSFQGFTRAILSFLGKKSVKEYKIEKPEKDYKVTIDKSVKKVRPHTTCAIVKNLKFDDEKIKNIIDIQEKLHLTYGRNRKKLAIGVYPLEEIKLPITFLAKKPEDIRFQPLEFPREINARQILSQHPAGREYANLLKDEELFPIFIDANNEILSMPPIINSHKTGKITNKTKEVFIEVSGFNLGYLKKALNIIVTALDDMGGKIYSMEINDKEGKYLSPNLEPEKMPFSIDFMNKTLGLKLTEKEIIKLLEKMNISYENKNQSIALIPSYRTDILHEIDIAEEIAISYGYENFIPEIPQISTIGEEDKISILKRKVSEILIGTGLSEISTYHLSTKEKQFKNIGIKDFKTELIEIIDSKTENNILRTSLLAQSIEVLSNNSDATYPQKIFEIGKIFYDNEENETKIGEKESLCISLCNEKANFTEIKQTLDYLMRMLDIEYEIKEAEHPSFITGRCAKLMINNKPAGILGEINPFVLKNNKIKMPVSSIEMDIEMLLA